MSQYRIGTASVTSGSNLVYGTDVEWTTSVSVDDWFVGPDKIKYNIIATGQLGNDQFISLSVPYGGATLADQTYVIHRDFIDGKPLF